MAFKNTLCDYQRLLGVLLSNFNHEYIELDKYFKKIEEKLTKTKALFAMLFYIALSCCLCKRKNAFSARIFIKIDMYGKNPIKGKKGINNNIIITSEEDIKIWLTNCKVQYPFLHCLLDYASPYVWYQIFKALKEVNLIEVEGNHLKVLFPVEGKLIPLVFASSAFQSRLKKDTMVADIIYEKMKDVPKKLMEVLNDRTKKELIDELVYIKTKNISYENNKDFYEELKKEIVDKIPNEYGNQKTVKDRETLITDIMEEIFEPEKIQKSKVEEAEIKKRKKENDEKGRATAIGSKWLADEIIKEENEKKIEKNINKGLEGQPLVIEKNDLVENFEKIKEIKQKEEETKEKEIKKYREENIFQKSIEKLDKNIKNEFEKKKKSEITMVFQDKIHKASLEDEDIHSWEEDTPFVKSKKRVFDAKQNSELKKRMLKKASEDSTKAAKESREIVESLKDNKE